MMKRRDAKGHFKALTKISTKLDAKNERALLEEIGEQTKKLEKQFDDEARARPINVGRGRPRLIQKDSTLSSKLPMKMLGKRSTKVKRRPSNQGSVV